MKLGLDIGTMNLAAAYDVETDNGDDGGVDTRRVRDAFIEVSPSDEIDSSISIEMLERAGANYIEMDNQTYVLGDDALEFSNLSGQPLRRPMSDGVLNPDESKRKALLNELISGVAGDKTDHGVVFSSPASPINDDYDVAYHERVIKDLLIDIGFDDPESMTESMAIVLEEFPDSYSGLGLSLGAGMANISLAWRGVPVLEFSMQKSGDWIDEGVAEKLREQQSTITHVKENDDFNVAEDSQKFDKRSHEAISIYYDLLADNLITGVNHLWDNTDDSDLPQISNPVPIVMAGGTSMADGMVDLLRQKIETKGLPFDVESIERAGNALYTPAKGLLRAAKME